MTFRFLQWFFAVSLAFATAQSGSNNDLFVRYEAATTPSAKALLLGLLLRSEDQQTRLGFYSLLNRYGSSDIIQFKLALGISGSCRTVTDVVAYVNQILQPAKAQAKAIIGKAKDPDGLTPVQRQRLEEISAKYEATANEFVQVKLKLLENEIRRITRTNLSCLINGLKSAYQVDDNLGVALLGGFITLQEEDGFEALLRSCKTKDDQTMVFMVVDLFGPHAVIPTLKVYEDPSSSESLNDTAGVVLLRLADHELIWDKVAEAYKHGRYYPVSTAVPGKRSATDALRAMLKSVDRWWANIIRYKYRENAKFTEYVARTHLQVQGPGQERVIELISSVDFATALPFLSKLDFRRLAPECLDQLRFSATPPSSEIFGKPLRKERFTLYQAIFRDLDAIQRERLKLIVSLGNYNESDQRDFLNANFPGFTAEEKSHALYLCSRLSPATRKAVFANIRPYCTGELLIQFNIYQER